MDSQHSISPHYSPAFQLFQLHLSERIFHCDYPGSFSPPLQLKIFPTPWCMAYLRDGQTCRRCVQGSAQELLQTCSKRRQSGGSAPLHSQLTSQKQSSTHVKQAACQKNVERNIFEGNLFSRMFQTRQIRVFPYCEICLPGSKAVKLLHRLSRAIRHCFLYPELMEELHFSHGRNR